MVGALSREQLEAIIAAGNFDALIGQVEGLEFDCKDQPYQLHADSGKRELAKDVSAFANAAGGFIFLGIKTKTSTSHFGDEVEEIHAFAQSLVNTTQYVDVIAAWVYPDIVGVEVRWVPTASDGTKGVVVINVPQRAANGPFLITKTLDGTKVAETVFGYASRKGDRNPPLGVKELQGYLRSGIHYQEKLEERMDAIEALLKRDVDLITHQAVQQGQVKKITERVEGAIKHGDLKSGRLIVISAQPSAPKELRTIFSSNEGSIKKRLEHPPIVRQHGWTLETLDQARIIRGEMVRVTNGNRKVLDLYRDGTMIFAASADSDFLAWGKEGALKINPLALIEVVYSFMTLYQLVIADFIDPPEEVSFEARLLNMHLGGKKNVLGPYALTSTAQMIGLDSKEAPEDNWTTTISLPTKNFDPAAAAYGLVREVYLWFGLEEDKIPYSKNEDDVRKIDPQAIIKS